MSLSRVHYMYVFDIQSDVEVKQRPFRAVKKGVLYSSFLRFSSPLLFSFLLPVSRLLIIGVEINKIYRRKKSTPTTVETYARVVRQQNRAHT